MSQITPDLLLHAYAQGFFPMAESAASKDVFWVDPEQRGIMPLDHFHMPRRLARSVRQDIYTVTLNRAFRSVMEGCAAVAHDRDSTWINQQILGLYTTLHNRGHAHSIEAWQGGQLVGGLYGVSLGGAFFGESMFHRARDASKIALVHLIARLKAGGFQLLDTQFITDHLQQFGTIEIPRKAYHKLLEPAVHGTGDIGALPDEIPGAMAVQLITQTS